MTETEQQLAEFLDRRANEMELQLTPDDIRRQAIQRPTRERDNSRRRVLARGDSVPQHETATRPDTHNELLTPSADSDEKAAFVRRLAFTGVLVVLATAAVVMLRPVSETLTGRGPAAAPAAVVEGETPATIAPVFREEEMFSDEWVVKAAPAGAGPNTGLARSAMYVSDSGASAVVVVDSGTFSFTDLEKIKIGAVEGWSLPDPNNPDTTFISVSGDEGITHLRITGLGEEAAIDAAAELFVDGRTSFVLSDESTGRPSDTLPAGFGGFVLVGDSQPGFSPSVSDVVWLATNPSSQVVQLSVYVGDVNIAVAQAEVRLNGATERPDGVFFVEAGGIIQAQVGWMLEDGRFAVLTSSDVAAVDLLEIAAG